MKTCKNCGSPYDPAARAAPRATWYDLERMEYCTESCARSAENRRYYQSRRKNKKAPIKEAAKGN